MRDVKKYYRQGLCQKDRQNYDIMLKGITTFRNVIVFSRIKNYLAVMDAIKLDNPQCFYVEWGNGVAIAKKKYCTEGIISFNKTEAEAHRLSAGMKEIAQSFNAYGCAREKVVAVYKHLTENVIYYNSLAQGNAVYNAVGSLVNGRAVCEGIAHGLKLILDHLGIDSMILRGHIKGGTEGHAWNIARLGDVLLHLDATQDLKGDKKIARFDYCLLSDNEIRQTHLFEGKFNKSTKNHDSYFARENRIYKDLSTLKTKLYAINDNKREFSFKIADTSVSEESILGAIKEGLVQKYNANVKYQFTKGHLNSYYITWEVNR